MTARFTFCPFLQNGWQQTMPFQLKNIAIPSPKRKKCVTFALDSKKRQFVYD